MPHSSHLPDHRRLHTLRNLVAAAATIILVASLGACAGERPTLDAAASVSTATTATTTATTATTATTTATTADGTAASTATSAAANAPGETTAPAGPRVLGPADLLGYIATPDGAPVVRATKDDAGEVIDVPARTTFGAPTTFAVVGDPMASGDPWVEVLLPTRPNGATGWVERSSVTVTRTSLRMFVDLTARSLRVEDDGREVLSTTTAIGTDENPTPRGVAYVTELVDNDNPSGAYGPYAFGLAMHSETLSEFGGGDGQVGIHGTNQPQLIGQAVSHGCVRMTNENVQRMVDLELPLGVPVFIS